MKVVVLLSGCGVYDISVDSLLEIISAPCFMLDGKIDEIYNNTKMEIDKLSKILSY